MNTVSCQDLATMGRNIVTPVSVALATPASEDGNDGKRGTESNFNSVSVLTLNSILRVLPGKRLVALTQWQGNPAIIKLFFQAGKWRRHVHREKDGIELLNEAGLNTPQQYYYAETTDGQGAALISQYLGQARSLQALTQQSTSDDQYLSSVSRVVKTIGECHKHGIWQQDIHPDNFLLTQDKVFCIDGASVNKIENTGPLPESSCLANIILFLAQFPSTRDRFLPELFTNYQQSRADTEIHIAWELLREKVVVARIERLKNFEKKLFRSTTDNFCRSSATEFVIYKRAIDSADLQQFIRDPDSYIKTGQIVKAGNSSTVARINLAGSSFMVKRYNVKNFWHRLKRLLRPSRAHNSWLYGSLLQMIGISTATPFMCLERRWFWWLRSKAYFLCEDLAGETVADQLGTSQAQEPELLTSVLNAYKNLFEDMQQYNLSHGDMKATNFILKDNELFVLDLDAMRRHKSSFRFNVSFRKDLARFRKNWIANPNIDKRIQMLINDIVNRLT